MGGDELILFSCALEVLNAVGPVFNHEVLGSIDDFELCSADRDARLWAFAGGQDTIRYVLYYQERWRRRKVGGLPRENRPGNCSRAASPRSLSHRARDMPTQKERLWTCSRTRRGAAILIYIYSLGSRARARYTSTTRPRHL